MGTIATRPPEWIGIGDGVSLRRQRPGEAEAVAEAIATSLDELRPWLRWASDEAAQVEFQRERIRTKDVAWDEGREFVYSIVADGQLVGMAGLDTRQGPGILEIGYWRRSDVRRPGVITIAARALTTAALALTDIERVEIHCDRANRRSAAIPERLGFRLERVEAIEPHSPGDSGQQMIWVWPPTDD